MFSSDQNGQDVHQMMPIEKVLATAKGAINRKIHHIACESPPLSLSGGLFALYEGYQMTPYRVK